MTEPAPLTPHQRLTALYTLSGYGRQSARLAAELLAEHDAETIAGKDIDSSSQLGADASTLSSNATGILGAVADLIDVPFPAGDPDTERLYYQLLERRAWGAVSVIRDFIERGGTYPEWVASQLAEAAGRHPVTYPVHVPAEQAAGGGEQVTERTITVNTTDHGPVTLPEPDWCAGDHREGYRQDEIAHVGPSIDIDVNTERGTMRLLELMLWQDPFAKPAYPRGTAVHVVAHLLDGDHPGYDVQGLEGLVTDLLEAAGRVRQIARELASEIRR